MPLALFTVAWAILAIALVAAAIRLIPYRPMGLALSALVWALYRATFVQVHWAFLRPLDAWWVILVGLLLAGVVALKAIRRAQRAPWLGWAAIVIAVFAPFIDMFGAPFWGDWLHENPIVTGAIVLVLFVIGFATVRSADKAAKGVGVIAFALAAAIAIAWAQFGLTGSAGPTPAPTPTITTSASPAPSSGATPTATPSTTATSAAPSPSSTNAPTAPYVNTVVGSYGQVVGWDDVLFDVEEANATSEWRRLIDDNHLKLGFGWSDAQTWATTKNPDGKIAGARKVVVFGAPASEISDQRARELAGVASTPIDVARATACYSDLVIGGQVCPSGDGRVVLFIAPIGKAPGGTLLLKTGSGIVLDPSANGKVRLTPAIYTVVS